MNKTVTLPAAKAAASEIPVTKQVAAVESKSTALETSPAPEVVEPKKIDLNKQSIKDAIANGKALIKEGKSKADAAMEIFEALKDEEKDVVIAAFVQGATLTEKVLSRIGTTAVARRRNPGNRNEGEDHGISTASDRPESHKQPGRGTDCNKPARMPSPRRRKGLRALPPQQIISRR